MQLDFERARAESEKRIAAKMSNIDLVDEFKRARDAVTSALDHFERVAAMLAERTSSQARQGSPDENAMQEEINLTRKSVRRMVGILCDQTGYDYHQMWTKTYEEHNARTGYHAVVASKGRGSHLARVVKDGQLMALRDTVLGMFKKDKYGPQRVP